MAGGADAAVPIPWDRLRAWINHHEAAEATRPQNQNQHQPVPPLSRQQLQAISMLIDLVDEEPEDDGRDHVSALMLLIQKRGYRNPVFTDLAAVDIPTAGVFTQRWRTVCHIAHAQQFPDGFPAPGYGILDEAKGVPLFKSKKAAKQYAAKHAYAFLTDVPITASRRKPTNPAQQRLQQHATSAPQTQTHTTPAPPSPTTIHRSRSGSDYGSDEAEHPHDYMHDDDDDDDDEEEEQYRTEAAARSRPGPSLAASRPRGDFASDDGPSVIARVGRLAEALSLETPRFQVIEEETPGWFTASAVFSRSSPAPESYRVVRAVLGKAKAKEEVARRMLRWLEAEAAKRNSVLQDVMGDIEVKQEEVQQVSGLQLPY